MTRLAVCPGSFDPITLGHLDIIERAAAMFDEIVVAILHNPAKAGRFDPAQRIAFVQASVPEQAAVTVAAYADRLLVDVCAEVGADAIVKGLRGGTDFAYEVPMALMNRHLTGVETVFLAGDPAFEHVSSSLVSEVAAHGGDVSTMVPPAVWAALRQGESTRQVGRLPPLR